MPSSTDAFSSLPSASASPSPAFRTLCRWTYHWYATSGIDAIWVRRLLRHDVKEQRLADLGQDWLFFCRVIVIGLRRTYVFGGQSPFLVHMQVHFPPWRLLLRVGVALYSNDLIFTLFMMVLSNRSWNGVLFVKGADYLLVSHVENNKSVWVCPKINFNLVHHTSCMCYHRGNIMDSIAICVVLRRAICVRGNIMNSIAICILRRAMAIWTFLLNPSYLELEEKNPYCI